MSYTPTEWENGDIITAEKLNKIQEGIENLSMDGEGNVFMVYKDNDVLSKTWNEIKEAFTSGKTVICCNTRNIEDADQYVFGNLLALLYKSGYGVLFGDVEARNNSLYFRTSDPDGYPELQGD